MTYFQNVFVEDFISAVGPTDRQYNRNYKCPGNPGRGHDIVVTWGQNPFNLSGNDSDGNSKANLTLQFAIDSPNFKEWGKVAFDVRTGAASASAVTPEEIITLLNANATFAGWFTATLQEIKAENGEITRKAVMIRQNQKHERMKFFVVNGGAEEILKFNGRATVQELPSYFTRHTVANRTIYTDSLGMLIALNTGLNVDAGVINTAVDKNGKSLGYSSGTVLADWQLLKGTSDNFMFSKNTVDSSSRVTETILYPAGAVAGDYAKKTTYTYTGAKTAPDKVCEIPYVLTGSDLVTP